ncbi:MAG: HU family DNA-binding protein [Acidobacteriota bacterium]
MTRKEISKLIYNRHGGLLKKEADEILELILSIIKRELIKGRKITLSNFGTFQLRRRAGRLRRNPKTGAPVLIPNRQWLSFHPSKFLIKLVNSPLADTCKRKS